MRARGWRTKDEFDRLNFKPSKVQLQALVEQPISPSCSIATPSALLKRVNTKFFGVLIIFEEVGFVRLDDGEVVCDLEIKRGVSAIGFVETEYDRRRLFFVLLQFTIGVGVVRGSKASLLAVRIVLSTLDGLEEDVASAAEVEDGFDGVEEVGAARRDNATRE